MGENIKGIFFKLGISLCGLLACFFVLEIASRFFFEKPTTVAVSNDTIPSHEKDIITFGLPDKGLYVDTPTGIRLKRNSQAIVKNHRLSKRDIKITTNSLGYRYPELAPKQKDDFRVLVLGDSITLGDYVHYEKTFPFAIEEYLKHHRSEALSDKTIQVINAGVGAIDLQTELAILIETGLSIQPDIVLVALYLNDAVESPNIQRTRLAAPLNQSYFLAVVVHRIDILRAMYENKKTEQAFESSRKHFEAENKIASVDWRKANWMNDEAGFNRLIYAAFHDWGYAWSEQFWHKAKNILTKMKELSTTHQFELAVALLPVRYQVQSNLLKDEPQKFFEELMKDLNMKHFDLLAGLRRKYQEDKKAIFYDHCHYRPEGNKYIGRGIAQFLLDEVI